MTDIAITGAVVRHIDLPSGGWAECRDPSTVRAKDKQKVIRSISDPEKAAAASLDVTEGILCMLVETWEVPYLPAAPLPADLPSILGELTIPDYDTLINAVRPAIGLFFPTLDPADAGKPGTPTPPGSA